MQEELEIYDLKGKLLGTQDREAFYKEIREEYQKTGQITRQVKTVRLILMTTQGRVYIQKRSYNKKENPGLYDKTMGGHVKAGYTVEMAVTQECQEELNMPVVVLSEKDFRKIAKVADTEILGIAREIECVNNYVTKRKSTSGDFSQPLINHFYVGYYDGPIKFRDGESTGIEVFDLQELEGMVKKFPELFTEDLDYFLKTYKDYLVPLEKIKEL